MKKVLAFLFTFIVMMVVADIFQPSAIKAASAVPQLVIQAVSSTGTVLNGVASAVSAVPRETVQIVDSSGHIIDSFSGSGGSGTVSSVATLGLEVYYSVLNTTVGGITGYIHAYPYATHFEQAIEACPQNAWAGTHGYAQFNVIADANGDTELNITAGTNNSGGSTPTWPTSSSANIGTQTTDGSVTWEMIAVGTYAPSQACTIVVDPGTYTQTKMAIVGSGSTAMDVEDHNGFISCSVTGGAGNACLVMADKGTLHGSHSNSSNSGSEIGQTGSSIDAVVESESGYLHNLQTNPISYQQINWDVSGMWIAPNPNNTILQAAVWESGIDGQGYSQNDYVSAGPTGSTGWLVDHAGTNYWNNLVFNNVWIGLGGDAYGFQATAGTSHSGGQMVWTGGAIVDGNANTVAHVDLEGNSGGDFVGATFSGGPYIESATGESSSTDGFLINGARDVSAQNVLFDGGPAIGNCFHITNAKDTPILTGENYVGICNQAINNATTGYIDYSHGDYFVYPPNPVTNAWANEFHSTSYGLPTAPASALPKLTTASSARTGTIASGSNLLTLSGTVPSGLVVGNWIAVGGKTATDNPGPPCGTNWRATSASAKYASGCNTAAAGLQNAGGPTIPSGGSKGNSGILITPENTGGSTSIEYQVCIIDGAGGIGECSTPTSTSLANATQTWTNDNKLTWMWNQLDEPEAEVCKSTNGGSTWTAIGIALHSSLRDIGQPAITNDPDLPPCLGANWTQTQQRPEYLYAKIAAINTSTHVLTLSASALDNACSSGGCPVFSADEAGINAAINAAEAASVQVAGGGNETNSNQAVIVDSGQYTIGGQVFTGEQTGTVVMRGYGATLWSDNISGPETIITGSGCDLNSSNGNYADNCNRGGRTWFEGFKLVGNGSTSATYPDEYAMYIGGNNGTYIEDDTFNNFMGTWQGCISGNASGLNNDEHLSAGQGTSWTHVYFTNDRMIACGGPWVQIGDITAVDDPNFTNFFFKNGGLNQASNPIGPQSGNLFVGAFNPAFTNNRYQLSNNAVYGIHIANAQQGAMAQDYTQTPQNITGAMIALDGTVGFGVDWVDINTTTVTGIDGIDLINSNSGSKIISPVFYSAGANQLTTGVNFSADGSATSNNSLENYGTAGGGSAPVTAYSNLGTANFVLPDSMNSQPQSIAFHVDGTVTNTSNRYGVCPLTLRYGPGFQLTPGNSAPPTAQSYGVASGTITQLDTYTFSDAGTVIGDLYLSTGGVFQFGSPGCSPAPDGNGTATSASATTITVTATAGNSGDSAILICAGGNTTNTWTTPSGCTPISGATDTTTINSIAYECDNISGTSLSEACTMSPTAATMTGAIWAFKHVPTGSFVDRSSVRHNASGTTCTISNIATGRVAGSTAFATCDTPTQSITFSAPSNPWSLVSGSGSQGGMVWYLGPAGQTTGGGTMTMGTSVTTGFLFYLKPALNSSCTLCTAGDKLELSPPGTVEGETDVAVTMMGVK